MENRKELKGIIVAQARKFLGGTYSHNKDSKSETFVFEIYTDYRDVLADSTINEALESHATIEGARNHLYDYLNECNIDTFWEYEYGYAKEVVEYIEKNLDKETLDKLKEEDLLDVGEVRDILLDYDVMSVVLDCDEIFARSELDMIISLENDVSVDHEFSLSYFGGNLLEWIENTQELLNDGEIKEADISLITLLKSQGYTFEAFRAHVERYYNEEDYKPTDKFIRSLINECENTTSICNALVFTTKVNLCDYLNEKVVINSVSTKMIGGYVDFVYGGGSVLELRLKNDINLENVDHELFVDGNKYGYGIRQIYGEFLVRN